MNERITTKYVRARKRPIVVLAIQWTGDNYEACNRFTAGAFHTDEERNHRLYIYKSRVRSHITEGAWLVQEPDGNGFYPVTDSDFQAAYEVLDLSDYGDSSPTSS